MSWDNNRAPSPKLSGHVIKYVLITGGVLSGLGKGVIASSTGLLLKSMGYRVTHIKIDPYINIDAGTMSPFEHGEVFVLDDGGEVDLDLGNYERFVDINLTRGHNITTGKIYQSVIEKERRGEYLGKTVQVVPHIVNEIQDWVCNVSKLPVDGSSQSPDICIIELGGTVGDIESMPFIEAMRQFQYKVGSENFANIHVSLVPSMGTVGEQKSKPTQKSVRELRALGLTPDIIACRSTVPLSEEVRKKIAEFCMVKTLEVLTVYDVNNLYHVPLLLNQQFLPILLLQRLHVFFVGKEAKLTIWKTLAEAVDNIEKDTTKPSIKIGLVGKYTGLSDSYLSVLKAISHASVLLGRKVEIEWIEASHLEREKSKNDDDHHVVTCGSGTKSISNKLLAQSDASIKVQKKKENERKVAWDKLKTLDGILVPGGFGIRGTEGLILAAKYAREHKIPYLGICLGMQTAVIEYCRNVLGWEKSNSEEFDPNCDPKVIVFMLEISKTHMGGTMRLGARTTIWKKQDCLATNLYETNDPIVERHRHRYEVNPELVKTIEEKGELVFVGVDENRERMEIMEMNTAVHPFYFGTQFHPEFKTRPHYPSPPFVGLVRAAVAKSDESKGVNTDSSNSLFGKPAQAHNESQGNGVDNKQANSFKHTNSLKEIVPPSPISPYQTPDVN